MPLVRVADLTDLPPGAVVQFQHQDRAVAVGNDGGTLFALDGRCPHHGGPLGQGNLEGGHVICPWHAWPFCCRTGELEFNPAVRLERFGVEVRDGGVFVELP
jgi:nitrite reductase (NADH) small subunit